MPRLYAGGVMYGNYRDRAPLDLAYQLNCTLQMGGRRQGEHLVERLDVGENQLRALALQFLQKQGAPLQPSNVTPMETSR